MLLYMQMYEKMDKYGSSTVDTIPWSKIRLVLLLIHVCRFSMVTPKKNGYGNL